MDNNTVGVQININANTGGATQAESALQDFGSQLQQIQSIAAGIGITSMFDNFVSAGKDAIGMVSDFQTATTAIGTVLGNIGDTSSQVSDTVGAAGGKVKNTLQEMTDATITYQEKVTTLQDKIADVMKGDNVIDAQSNMYYQLDQMAEAHAQKVADLEQQIVDIQTQEANNLTDMQGGQDVKMQNLAEKHGQEMADATSDLQRVALQKKYDEEVQYDTDAFNRQLALKKSQMDRDSAAKITNVQEEIADENQQYADKYAHEQAMDEQRISDLQATNAKELAQYKQQLGDEERSYDEHIAKLKESAASGGGSSGSNSFTALLPSDSQWAAQKTSLNDWLSSVNQMASKSPFNYADIVQYGRLVEAQHYNFLKLEPDIENIASASGKTFGTTTQALLDGVNGRIMMLEQELGISKETLIKYGAEYDKQGHLMSQSSFFKAIDAIAKGPDAGASEKQLHTLSGAYSNVQDSIFRTSAALLGMDPITGQTSGAFKSMSDVMVSFSQYLLANQSTIVADFQKTATVVEVLASALTVFLLPALIKTSVDGVVKLTTSIANYGVAGIKAAAQTIYMAAQFVVATVKIVAQGIATVVTTVATYAWTAAQWLLNAAMTANPIGLVIVAVGLLAAGIIFAYTHSETFRNIVNKLWDAMKSFWNFLSTQFMATIKDIANFFQTIANTAGSVIDAISKVGGHTVTIGNVGHNALGTASWGGGATWVGENGPEIVVPPAGSQIVPNNQTNNYGGSKGVTMNNTFNIKNVTDFSAAAKMLGLQVALATH